MSNGTSILLVKLIDLFLLGMQMNAETRTGLNALRGQLAKMADEKRDPTDQEWEELNKTLGEQFKKLMDNTVDVSDSTDSTPSK